MNKFNARKPLPPPPFLVKALQNTSWTKIMQGSYKYAIEMRSKGTIEKLKRYHQREKDRAAKKGRAMNWFNKLWTVVVYLIVIFGLMALLLPSIAMNYIKSQVKTGEWGGDFKAEDFINRYNYTAPVE